MMEKIVAAAAKKKEGVHKSEGEIIHRWMVRALSLTSSLHVVKSLAAAAVVGVVVTSRL